MLRLVSLFACLFIFSQEILVAQIGSSAVNYRERFFKEGSILYPEVTNWHRLDTVPKLSSNYLLALHPKLKEAVTKYCQKYFIEERGFIFSLIDTQYGFPESFYEVHANRDTLPDIVYSGIIPGQEFNGTVIWYRTADGFEIRQFSLRTYLLIAFERGDLNATNDESALKLYGVSKACCGGLTNTYTIENPTDVMTTQSINASILMNFPEKGGIDQVCTAGRAGIHLRTSPKVDEVYDSSFSFMADKAVLGNTVAVYIAGASGRIISKVLDAQGQVWCLVVIDRFNNHLRYYSVGEVECGWVKENELVLQKQAKQKLRE